MLLLWCDEGMFSESQLEKARLANRPNGLLIINYKCFASWQGLRPCTPKRVKD
jgi:hypothetical protein